MNSGPIGTGSAVCVTRNGAGRYSKEAGARRLLTGYDERSLQSLVNDLRLLRDEADRNAYEQPSPDALRSYRRVARELAEAETALSLLA